MKAHGEERMKSLSTGEERKARKAKKRHANRKSAAEGKGPQDGPKETGSSAERK